jgi:hypothetical protein
MDPRIARLAPPGPRLRAQEDLLEQSGRSVKRPEFQRPERHLRQAPTAAVEMRPFPFRFDSLTVPPPKTVRPRSSALPSVGAPLKLDGRPESSEFPRCATSQPRSRLRRTPFQHAIERFEQPFTETESHLHALINPNSLYVKFLRL